MELNEVSRLKGTKDEKELISILEKIGDKIVFKSYGDVEIIIVTKEIVKIDLLSKEYETREEILSVLCDVVSYYDIYTQINWNNILKIKGDLEDDLKEYVDEFLDR